MQRRWQRCGDMTTDTDGTTLRARERCTSVTVRPWRDCDCLTVGGPVRSLPHSLSTKNWQCVQHTRTRTCSVQRCHGGAVILFRHP
ncbi:hypothetical protein J6590_106158, partial [Homalodisca vitripennis]